MISRGIKSIKQPAVGTLDNLRFRHGKLFSSRNCQVPELKLFLLDKIGFMKDFLRINEYGTTVKT
ncbi:MAG: hypothetical protein ABIJ42_03050, partial [Acidobacteriota bacterium]